MTKQEAIDHYGGVPALAKALNVSRPAIYQWAEIPPLRQVQLQRLTRGRLKADEAAYLPKQAG